MRSLCKIREMKTYLRNYCQLILFRFPGLYGGGVVILHWRQTLKCWLGVFAVRTRTAVATIREPKSGDSESPALPFKKAIPPPLGITTNEIYIVR